ncbi:MAG: hypothetical protein Q7Q73_16400 [Verrucomicrobiota bacterium JB024]|nr:hypothetical protein [Verrucomicrobiota bacterium JB024]
MKTLPSPVISLAALLAISATTTSFAEPVQTHLSYQEDFAPTSTDDSLAGRVIGEEYSADWCVDRSVMVTPDGTATTNASGAAWFALPPGVQSVEIQAEILPGGSDWVALALGGKWYTAFYDTAQLWVLLRPSGYYELHAKGSQLMLQEGQAPGYKSGQPSLVMLGYDKAANTATLCINGETVVDAQSLDPAGFTPELGSAGFRINGPLSGTATPRVDNFKLTAAAAIEPGLAIHLGNELAVYKPGEAVDARFAIRGLPTGDIALNLSLMDFYGKVRWTQRLPLHADSIRPGVSLTIPSPGEDGYFQLRAELIDSGRPLASATKPIAVIPEPPAVTRTDANAFGAMVYPHLNYPLADKELDARFMRRIGLRHVRTHRLNWIHAQRSPDGPFLWASLDDEVALYQKYGLNIIATTAWPIPNWASQARDIDLPESKSNFMPTPEAMEQASRFYREMAERYRGQIELYEIGNEVDAHFWLGSLDSYREHDVPGVMADYYDYFSELAEAIYAGDPDARVAPNTTSETEGHSYRPWLTTQLDLGLGDVMTAYSTHYDADLDYANAKLAEYGVNVPVYFTEIGGFTRGQRGDDPLGPDMKAIIREDYRQFVTQLTHPNVRAMCKFLLREQPTYGGEGTIRAGLLGVDFSINPAYPAFATLVRELAGARYVRPLNITDASKAGWLRGYAFERDGQSVNVLFLNGGTDSPITLQTATPALQLVDVMGNTTELPAKDGEVNFTMSPELPVFILGAISDAPGTPVIPQDTLVREIVIPLENPGFELDPEAISDIPGWSVMANEQGDGNALSNRIFLVSADTDKAHSGQVSARMDALQPTQWYGLSQELPVGLIPRPGPNEYLLFTVSCYARGENIFGKGLGFTLAFRQPDFTRVYFSGSGYFGFGGTYEWKELTATRRLDVWPEQAERITLDLLLGKSTGTVWIDDVTVTVQLWKQP